MEQGSDTRIFNLGEGDNTINLFRKAKQNVADSPNGYWHVWVVYDTDDFPAEHIDKVVELWYLLHFSFMQSDLHRTEYWPKLTEWLESI